MRFNRGETDSIRKRNFRIGMKPDQPDGGAEFGMWLTAGRQVWQATGDRALKPAE